MTRDCNLPIFTTNETITNLTQYELSQEKSDLLKAGLYFSIQPDKIRKSKIFTTFEKIHGSFLNNLKSQETKSQIKAHLSYLANSYFYTYKPSPHILRQHRVLQNLRKNKYIVITKRDKVINSSSDSFPKFCLIVSSIGTFKYNLAHFLCDLLSPLVPND